MRPYNRGDASVEIPAQRNLFRSGFGMNVDQDHLGLNIFQKLISRSERIVIRGHEDPPLQVHHSVGNLSFAALIHAPAGHVGRIIRGTQDPARRTVPISFNHLEIVHNLALVPDVIAGRNHVDIQFEQLLGECGSNAEPSRRVFTVGDDQIDRVIADNTGKAVFDDRSPGTPEDVANEKNSHRVAKLRWYHA